MHTIVQTIPGQVEKCFFSEQERYLAYIAATIWQLDEAFTTIVQQTDAPGVEDSSKIWHKLNSDLTPTGRFYVWSSGQWITPHPVAPESDERRLYVGTLANLVTFDGGSAGTVSASAGPMWEEDTSWRNVIPVGASATGLFTTPAAAAAQMFAGAAGIDPKGKGLYIIKRTARVNYVG